MQYRLGNTTGKYFTQWRVDLLAELLEYLRESGLTANNAEIWYDPHEDYHYLSFMEAGNVVAIRFYKVFAISVNGVDKVSGILRSHFNTVRRVIADLTPLTPPVPAEQP